MNPAEIHGRRVAMLMWEERADGRHDAATICGIAEWDGRRLAFRHSPDQPPFEIADEWLGRIKPVATDVKDVLDGAEYVFSVTVGPLPDGADPRNFVKTNLRWPSSSG